jgi:hypothetical protein
MSLIVPDVLSLAAVAFITNTAQGGRAEFSNHALLGYASGFLLAISSITGYFATLIPASKYIRAHMFTRIFHKVFAWIVFPLLVVNSYIGAAAIIAYIPGAPHYLAYVPVFLPVLTILCAFMFKGAFKMVKGDKSKAYFETNMQVLPFYEWEEIEARVASGSKWLIIDDTVCKSLHYLTH